MKAFHLIFLGISAICAQTIFTRELMTLFAGTEFVIGLILASWLFWIGIGGAVGGRIKCLRRINDFGGFAFLSALLSFLLPATVIAIRAGRAILISPPGSLPPLGQAALFSVIIQAPFCFVYGHMYNVMSDIWLRLSDSITTSVSRVYIFEAAGSTVGALMFSFALIPYIPQLLTAVVVAIAFMFAVIAFPISNMSALYRRVFPAAAISVFLIVSLQNIDTWSMRGIFKGYSLKDVEFSRYGEIVLASHREMITVFSQGARLLSVPEPERVEEVVHIPMALHPEPGDILMIGGGLGGGVEEVLKYPSVRDVDCIEIDRKILLLRGEIDRWLYRTRPDSLVEKLQDKLDEKVRFIRADGRFFLKRNGKKYDVIIMNVPPPFNLQLNRFYTVEFFKEARKSLKPGGIFAFTHPSSENFLTHEQAEIIGTIERTLKRVFDNVLILPGDVVHFIASDRRLEKESIVANLEKRHIRTIYINRNFLPYRFSTERMAYLESAVGRAGSLRINTDSHPFVSFLEFLLEAKREGFTGALLFGRLLRMSPFIPFLIAICVLFLIVSLARGGSVARIGAWSVGFTSFIIQILILLQFQSFSGLLYHAFIVLTAVFMVGASLGAFIVLNRRGSWSMGIGWFHLIFAIFSLFLAGFTKISTGIPYWLGLAVFMLLSLISGILTGGYYPSIVSIGFGGGKVGVPSEFYAWDLFGACLGGFLGGVFFFPLFGVVWTSVLLFLVNLFIFFLLPGKLRAAS